MSQFKCDRGMGGRLALWMVMSASYMVAAPVMGQPATSAPSNEPVETKFLRTHEEFLAASREHPPIGGIYLSAETKMNLTGNELKPVREIETLLANAAADCDAGSYDVAKRRSNDAMAAARKLLGPTHFLSISATGARRLYGRYTEASKEQQAKLSEGDRYRREAIAAYKLSDFAKSEQLAKRAVEIRDSVVGMQYAELVDSDALRIMAMAQTEGGRTEQAEKTFVRLMELLERSFGKLHPKMADALTRRGWLRLVEGRTSEAIEDLRRALAIHETSDGETLEAARAMDHLGTALAMIGDPEGAVGRKIRSLMIRETLAGTDSPETAESYSNLAWLYHQIGMHAPVTPLRLKALAIFEKHLGLDHTYTFTEISNLTRTYEDLGQYDEAIKLYEKYLAKPGQKSLLEQFRLAARLGSAYLRVGRKEDAQRLFQMAIKDLTAPQDEAARRLAIGNASTAVRAYMQMHYAEDAVSLLDSAVKALASAGAKSTKEDILRPAELGTLYEMVGRNEEAIAKLREAITLARASKREDKQDTIIMLLFAQVTPMLRMKNFEAAETICEEALRLTDDPKIQGSTVNALALILMGKAQAENKQYDRAKFYLEEAAKLFKAHNDAASVPYFHYLTEYGKVLGSLGDKAAARSVLAEAVEKTRNLVKVRPLPEHEYLLMRALKAMMEVEGDSSKAAKDLRELVQRKQKERGLIADMRDWPKELGV